MYASLSSRILLPAPVAELASGKCSASVQSGASSGALFCAEAKFPAGPCAGAGLLRESGFSLMILLGSFAVASAVAVWWVWPTIAMLARFSAENGGPF